MSWFRHTPRRFTATGPNLSQYFGGVPARQKPDVNVSASASTPRQSQTSQGSSITQSDWYKRPARLAEERRRGRLS